MNNLWRHCLLCESLGRLQYGICERCFSQLKSELFASYAFGNCPFCGSPLLHEDSICRNLLQQPYCPVYKIGPYSGYFKEVILKYKYHQCKKLSIYLASLLSSWIENYIDVKGNVWIIPVPCSRTGKIIRGWDQMQVIAKILDHIPGATYHDLLGRIGNSEQKLLGRQERMDQSTAKFKLQPSRKDGIYEKGTLPVHAIVIDDVFTTGATIKECIALVESCFSCPTTGICLAMD